MLVDEHNQPIGQAEKIAIHNENTPLHRGFSVFLFNKKGELLLQQRSSKKKTWPLIWSNSCCGHPKLDESSEDAAKRRLHAELGIAAVSVQVMIPDYRYYFVRDGVAENEFCPILVAISDQKILPNPDEVEQIRWVGWEEWVQEVTDHPDNYSEWSVEETHLLALYPAFQEFLGQVSSKKHTV